MNDNERKVFDMLDVNPNEKFKVNEIEKENDLYCLNEKLIWYLLSNPELILNLPKEIEVEE